MPDFKFSFDRTIANHYLRKNFELDERLLARIFQIRQYSHIWQSSTTLLTQAKLLPFQISVFTQMETRVMNFQGSLFL